MHDRFSSRALSRMGRRGFLKTLTTLGVSASTAGVLTQDAVADIVDDPRREVPRIKAFRHTNHREVVEEGAKPEREPVVYTIPRWRWARVEAAHDARRQVEKQLDGNYPVWVTTDSNGEKKIVVEQYDDGNLRSSDVRTLDDQVPSSVTGVAGGRSRDSVPPYGSNAKGVGPTFGHSSRFAEEREVPVVVERPRISDRKTGEKPSVMHTDGEDPISTSDHEVEEDFHYLYEWDEIPAGACMQFGGQYEADGEPVAVFGTATAGFPAYRDGDQVMISAGHNWEWPDLSVNPQAAWADSLINTIPWDGGEYLTEDPDFDDQVVVDEAWNEHSADDYDTYDYSIMSRRNSADVAYNFAADSNGNTESWPVYGTVATERLRDLEDNGTRDNETLYQQGATTGRDECAITDVRDHSFRTDLVGGWGVQEGDSGGPVVLVESHPTNPDYPYSAAYPAGVISSYLSSPAGPDSRTFATTARLIEEEHSLRV